MITYVYLKKQVYLNRSFVRNYCSSTSLFLKMKYNPSFHILEF